MKRKSKTAPAPSITRLYKQFERAFHAMNAMPSTRPGDIDPDPRWERAVNKTGDIAWQIVKAPAASVEEILLKIKVAGWCVGRPHHGSLAELDHWTPDGQDEGYHALATLRSDLRRMVGAVTAG